MESSLNQFNWIARFYDPLVKIVFGKHVVNAQTYYLSAIEANSKVLILGGGTGWILKYLHDVQPSSIIYYVEASSKMIALAKKNSAEFTSRVHFIHGTENTIPSDLKFDMIVTNFYLIYLPMKNCHG
jgi:tRNA (cmo5U34)-methyltransferase